MIHTPKNADRLKGFDIMKKLNGDSEFYVFCRKSKTGTEPNKIAADVLQKNKEIIFKQKYEMLYYTDLQQSFQ